MATADFDQRVRSLSLSANSSMASVWIASTVTVVVFATLWRISLRPHPAWWIITTISVGACVVCATWFTYRLWLLKSRRLWSLGILLLATTPVVWLACFSWYVLDHTGTNGFRHNTPVRILGWWAMSYADVEASLAYSRRVHGKHVELIDDGDTPNAAKLVREMDDHIQSMSDLLGQPVPPGRSAWVRGKLLWFDGRAVGPWAICDTQNTELDYLDRHEVAHTLIFRLCGPDNDPPSLLAEGWAEYQSVPVDDMIRTLKELADGEEVSPLSDLVSPKYYDRPIGDMYTHGGPLVAYLIERYGPETFFELYRDVRQSTFLSDGHRILGESWASVESDFWNWLDVEAERRGLLGEPKASFTITLSDDANPEDWQTAVRANQESRSQLSKWPKYFAMEAEFNRNGKRGSTVEVVRDNGDLWQRNRYSLGDSSYTEYLKVTSTNQCVLLRDSDGIQREVDAESIGVRNIDEYISYSVKTIQTDYLGMAELGRVIPLDEGQQSLHVHILSIAPLDGHAPLWRLLCEVASGDATPDILEIQLDPRVNWNVRRYTCQMPDDTKRTVEFEFEEFLGSTIATKRIQVQPGGDRSEMVIRVLNRTAADEVRESVDAAARQGPAPEWTPLRERILQPQCLAIGWPLCGLCLCLFGRRRRNPN